MKRKKSSPTGPKKEPARPKETKAVPSWLSLRLLVLPLLLLAGIVWYGYFALHTNEISGSDDREYASIARNIVNGRGIVRDFVYPVDINFFEKLPVPDFMHPPGYPLILAGFFKLFGISGLSALLPSYISYFLLVILFFHFVRTYLEIRTAVVATVMLIFTRDILDVSIVALSEAVYTVFLFVFFWVFIRAKSLRDLFLAGIVLGASHLIRENIYPFLIPLFLYLFFYPDLPRSRKMIVFAAGILIPLLPNFIRTGVETGSPFFSYGKFVLMAFTERYPMLNIYRDILNPSLLDFLREAPGQIALKYVTNFSETFKEIASNFNPVLLVFFVLDMFIWRISPACRRIKLFFLSLFVSQILFVCLFVSTHRFFIPFLPMMVFFASQSVLRVSNALAAKVTVQWRRRVLILSSFIILCCFVIPTVKFILTSKGPPQLGFRIPQAFYLMPTAEAEKLTRFLKDELKEDKVVWADIPEILEWEGNRPCGWLPNRIETVYEINKKFPVDAILLTNLGAALRPMEEEWKQLLRSEEGFPRFRTVKQYKSWPLFAVLIIRDEKE